MTKAATGSRPAYVLFGAFLVLALLALGSLADTSRPAEAVHNLTIGIDADISTTNDGNGDGVYETLDLGLFEDCIDIPTLLGVVAIDVFVIDIENLVAFETDIAFPGSVLNITVSDTLQFLDSNLSSITTDISGATPDSSGTFEAAAVDIDLGAAETGSGILARLTLKGVATGVATVSLNTTDINGDTLPDKGTTLTDTANNHPGDTIGNDGFFDGPYINKSITVAVNQPDTDGDGASNGCDPDDDGDGICDIGGPLPPGTPGAIGGCSPGPGGVDNCPLDSNNSQSDLDLDGQGDPCDVDTDGDGFVNVEEIARGSSETDAGSTPEVCDDAATDEDGDTAVNEGYDGNTNGQPDCTELGLDSDGDTIPNPSDSDDDNDSFTDVVENYIATHSLVGCADTTTNNDEWDDKWGPDATDNRDINILDVLKFKPAFNSAPGDSNWRRRFDLDTSGPINILDILKIKPHFNGSCLP